LGVGIDWAEQFHLVALGRGETGVFEVSRVEHTPTAVTDLLSRIVEPDPAEVRVVIETSHGMLVGQLLGAGFTVVPVNPDLIARRRGPARKKDDAEDARIACLLALDRFAWLRPLIPHRPVAAELRAIARDDERANRDERRLLNRLRADLIATFPAALQIAGQDMGRPTFLRLLERWPTDDALSSAAREQITEASNSETFTARDYLVRAKADTIRLTATQLLAIGAQRRVWENRMGHLLLGSPRTRRATNEKDNPPGQAFPGGEIYLSFPGLGDRLAARVAGEIGEHIEQFDSPNALACYAGKAPVTRRSGKSEYVVACRLVCNRYLRDSVQQWAFCSLTRSGWARRSTTGTSPTKVGRRPRIDPVPVIVGSPAQRAIPKSVSFTRPSPPINTFAGFTSRWVTPRQRPVRPARAGMQTT
jgi:transposase